MKLNRLAKYKILKKQRIIYESILRVKRRTKEERIETYKNKKIFIKLSKRFKKIVFSKEMEKIFPKTIYKKHCFGRYYSKKEEKKSCRKYYGIENITN